MISLRPRFSRIGVWYAAALMTAVRHQLDRDKRSVSIWRLRFPAPRFPIPTHWVYAVLPGLATLCAGGFGVCFGQRGTGRAVA
jgi:hypothetical protein